MTENDLREQVRSRYAKAAIAVTDQGQNEPAVDALPRCCQSQLQVSCCDQAKSEVGHFGPELYSQSQQDELPEDVIAVSLGCGNPIAVAELRPGEVVLDLGSGGGIDVLLSARRVGPTGFVYGLDMTDEMLALANRNKTQAGATNVEFLKGTIEQVPLPNTSVNVVISNCVINLSVNKPAVIEEMFRVLKPGGRIGIADVVAEDQITPAQRAERGSYAGCIAGALSRTEYIDDLTTVGFTDVNVQFINEVVPNMHSAIIQATKPTP